MTASEDRLLKAIASAVWTGGVPLCVGLMDLEEYYDGPACGAAGSIVRRWPAEGKHLEVEGRSLRLRWERDGRRTVVVVEDDLDDPSNAV